MDSGKNGYLIEIERWGLHNIYPVPFLSQKCVEGQEDNLYSVLCAKWSQHVHQHFKIFISTALYLHLWTEHWEDVQCWYCFVHKYHYFWHCTVCCVHELDSWKLQYRITVLRDWCNDCLTNVRPGFFIYKSKIIEEVHFGVFHSS